METNDFTFVSATCTNCNRQYDKPAEDTQRQQCWKCEPLEQK